MSIAKFSKQTPSFVGRFLNDEFFDFPFHSYKGNLSVPAVNVKEDENSFQIEVAAPGMKKEDFKVQVNHNYLTVSAEHKTEHNIEDKGYKIKEFGYSNFKRSFTLPEHVDDQKINAKYEDGILKLELPKIAEKDPKHVRLIEVS